MRKLILAVVLAAAWSTTAIVPAAAAPSTTDASWTGLYTLERFAATKSGSSLAARQSEPDFSDDYTFVSTCMGGPCVATVIGGPPPKNPTLPQPPQYTWDGTSWVHVYDWMWDCYQGPNVPRPLAPAHSVATYTPQPDGTFSGVWRTVIDSGPCVGDVVMNVAAYPVQAAPLPFGSS
ncbi:hypothetical protein QM797_16985 [Rhodococcus sp. IEGM 1381]|uniref:hypothetical protein n=1 Tax=Rhodococcus sp. IEGM 1381 TaxID=3047085 RepID=UPI0024B7839F|nr:hypothetical protein [Rhodococcus sp. IEGM 1381]MDI9896424.1 hypothetical protein [Rhodococcus sp. IEGM 1381]